ncbi:MAG: hypothetical protein U0796_12700 [Gemmatales bacterium]
MPDRQHIRLARWLHQIWQDWLGRRTGQDYEWSQLKRGWERVLETYRRCQLAQEHGLFLCLPGLRADLLAALTGLADAITILRASCQSAPKQELTQSHWYQEVVQLHDEFPAVTFLRGEGKLSVETPAITLAGVELGAFSIDFKKDRSSPTINDFVITALDANPASQNDDVTHPHVKDGELCAGDAKEGIKVALASGRLVDVFLLIQSVLQNYNPNSAYVKLDQWHGTPCTDCSRTVDPDDSYSCNRCGNTLCDNCFSSCSSCSSSFCPGCIRGCTACHVDCCESCLDLSEGNGDPLCRDCRTNCDGCDKLVGKDELDEESQLCQACSDQEEEELPEETPVTQEVSHS